MKFYIRIKHTGEYFDQSCYAAYDGCSHLGIPVIPYKAVYSIRDDQPEDPIVGTYDDAKVIMDRLGFSVPPLDYPEELKPFLGRKIWKSTLFTITSHSELWHVFVKPVTDVKRFRGTVLDKSDDLVKLGGGLDDIDVWCSEKVNFLSEWRLWVLNGKIAGLNFYRGRWDVFPDTDILKEAVRAYRSAPSAYALDFGVTDENKTLLIEVSDGYALSSFGLNPELYVRILQTRWEELARSGSKDKVNQKAGFNF